MEVAKAIGAKVSFEETYIYEFVISKVAEFVVDRSAFDETAFNKL